MIYFTSDLHFFHNRDFLYDARGFRTIEEHNEAIINNWNSIVAENDIVYILGDCMLNDNDAGMECLRQLNGNKFIIRGNHDTDARWWLYKEEEAFGKSNINVVGYADVIKYGKYHFYLSHYPTLTSNYDDDKPLKTRVINLCGHTHTKDRWLDFDKGLIYHVELDAHEMKPVSADTIINEIKEKLNEKK